jgi:hypothetical protein
MDTFDGFKALVDNLVCRRPADYHLRLALILGAKPARSARPY